MGFLCSFLILEFRDAIRPYVYAWLRFICFYASDIDFIRVLGFICVTRVGGRGALWWRSGECGGGVTVWCGEAARRSGKIRAIVVWIDSFMGWWSWIRFGSQW